MTELKKVIMKKYDWDEQEADSSINEARTALQEYLDDDDQESAYNICEEYFGLEPDYIMDLM